MGMRYCLAFTTILLFVVAGCGQKQTTRKGLSSSAADSPSSPASSPATNGPPKTTQASKDAKLPTTEELEAKLKGKSAKEVLALLGDPSREYGMETGAGRLVYDKKIATNPKLGKSVGGTVWFARDVVDSIQFDD